MNLSPYQNNILRWLLAVLIIAALAFFGIRYPQPDDIPPFPSPVDVEVLGVSHFSGMQVQGSETDELVVDQTSTGDIVEFRDNGTVVWRLSDGGNIYHNGELDLNGQKLDLDADADTSVEADTDDQIDWEIGGADVQVWKDFGTGTVTTAVTEHLVEILDTTRVISTSTGTSTQTALNIDLGIGNTTAGTSLVNGILIDGITQDAQNTETGIVIGNGWDRGIDLDGNALYMDNDQDSYFSELADDSIGFTPGAATGSLEIRTGNLQVGNGSPGETHNGEDFYVEGISEFDGSAYFDGAVDMDSTLSVAGTLNNSWAYAAKTASFTPTVAQSGSWFSNIGASESITFYLPTAASGLWYCFYVGASQILYVEPASADQILHLTNSTEDSVKNATDGDRLCVLAADATNWIATEEEGTWTDAE
jgi:hypothetical protein